MSDSPLVLIIDDEPAFLEIFSVKLTTAGFRVETAVNGPEGIGKAKALKPDLVLLDMQMPGMTGADVLSKLKEDPETTALKVVFLTNLGDPQPELQLQNERFSEEVGAAGYLKKAEDLDSLIDRIKLYL